MDIQTDRNSQVTTKIFEIDGLISFSKVWGSTHAPSVHRSFTVIQEKQDHWINVEFSGVYSENAESLIYFHFGGNVVNMITLN